MILELLVVATLTLAAGIACALAVRRLPRLAQQLVAVSLFAAVTPVLAVASTGALMLHRDDAAVVAFVAFAGALSVGTCALLLARHVAAPVADVHDAALALAAGDLAARAREGGPREAAELASAFNEMAASMQRTFEARRDLIAWASHDLRTPVSALLAMVEAVEDGVGTADRYLPQIADSVRHLRRLVEDLFDLARADQPLDDRTPPTCDASAVAEAAVRTHVPAAGAVTLELASDLPSTPVLFAELDLTRVLDNLLDNALRFARSSVRVHVRRDGSVTVSDDGPGFPPDQLSRACEPFWRADVTQQHQGAGLGLAIADRLARRNAAALTVTAGAGAVLVVAARPASSLPAEHSAEAGLK